ncbi:hypothetical protein niasHT_001500 [Heterodera trifolii]|uniref:Uncharacterized protein n=1 Tax=Heterodera trifolii TaxID=157864 RepID=A0ABD2MFK6_9BILA
MGIKSNQIQHQKDSKIEFFEPHKIGRRQKRVNVRELFQGAFQRIRQHGTAIACVFYVFAALMALFGVICTIARLVLFNPADYLSWLLLLWLSYVFGHYSTKFIKECTGCFRNNNNQIHSIELAENGPAAAGANGQ